MDDLSLTLMYESLTEEERKELRQKILSRLDTKDESSLYQSTHQSGRRSTEDSREVPMLREAQAAERRKLTEQI